MRFICTKYNKLTVLTPNGIIKFKNGEYETKDKEEIAVLNKTLDVISVDEPKEIK